MKRDANANVVLNNLYKHTPLQTSFGVHMLALVDGVPRLLNLAQALTAYIAHQVEVVTRRSRVPPAQGTGAERTSSRDCCVRSTCSTRSSRRSVARTTARRRAANLMAEPFSFSEEQANHILDMTLGRLTRLGRSELEEEMAELRATIAELEAILGDPVRLRAVISTELTSDAATSSPTPRRTQIIHDPGDLGAEDLIEDEQIVVTLTRAGYIKAVAADAFRAQSRGGRGVQGTRLKEEDLVDADRPHDGALAHLLLFSNRGKVYRLRAHEIPMKERTARGTPVVNLISLEHRRDDPGDRRDPDVRPRPLPALRDESGQVKKTPFSEYDKSRREGFIAINLHDGDELVRVLPTSGERRRLHGLARTAMTIRFAEDDVRPMGRSAAGVRGMRLRAGRRGRLVRRGQRRRSTC